MCYGTQCRAKIVCTELMLRTLANDVAERDIVIMEDLVKAGSAAKAAVLLRPSDNAPCSGCD